MCILELFVSHLFNFVEHGLCHFLWLTISKMKGYSFPMKEIPTPSFCSEALSHISLFCKGLSHAFSPMDKLERTFFGQFGE